MKKLKNILLIFLLISFVFVSSTHILWALEKDTHEFLNRRITRNYSVLSSYLKNHLGFSKGIEKTFVSGNQSKTVEEWIGLGGKTEDEPFYTRSLNHFHNPINNSGLGTFESAILWAEDQGSFGSLFGGNYSWGAVRDYYYLGLTSSTKTDREKNLADTFRGLGQLMHLIEDMSVPAHTRNDGHVLKRGVII